MAQIIIAKENNEPLDAVIYSEVMFTDEISGEFPEHRDFIYNVAIPKLKALYGLEVIVLRSPQTMWSDFHTVRVRGSTEGLLRGFPIPGACTINRDCKIPPIRNYLKSQTDDIIQYVGIAADEPKRLRRLEGTNKVSLLAKYGMTTNELLLLVDRHIRDKAGPDGKVDYDDVRKIIDNACYKVQNDLQPVKKFMFVEDGTVDVDDLEERLSTTNPEVKVVVYRQGGLPPVLRGLEVSDET